MESIESAIRSVGYSDGYKQGYLNGKADALKPIKDLLDSNVSQIYFREKVEEIVNEIN